MKEARIIGLIGGLSWHSTITYYREINRLAQARLGGSHSARMLIWSDDYHHVEQMQLEGRWEEARIWIGDAAERLERGGAELLGIACNTMHNVADAIPERSTLPIVDIIDSAAAACAASACPTALLGTRFTLDEGRYLPELARRGAEPIVPAPDDMAEVDRMIYEELCVGQATDRSRRAIRDIIGRLAEAGAGQVLLACTELNLIVDTEQVENVRVIDATRVHIDALVDASLGPSTADDRP